MRTCNSCKSLETFCRLRTSVWSKQTLSATESSIQSSRTSGISHIPRVGDLTSIHQCHHAMACHVVHKMRRSSVGKCKYLVADLGSLSGEPGRIYSWFTFVLHRVTIVKWGNSDHPSYGRVDMTSTLFL